MGRAGLRLAHAAVHNEACVVVVFHELRVAGGELRDERVHLVVQRGVGDVELADELRAGGAAGGHGVARLADARGTKFSNQGEEFLV